MFIYGHKKSLTLYNAVSFVNTALVHMNYEKYIFTAVLTFIKYS